MDTSQHPRRILALVDDDGFVSRLQEELAGQSAVEVIAVTDGLELVEEQAVRRTAVIVIDLDVVEDRVLRLATTLRTVDPHCRLVLLLSPEKLPLCEKVIPLGHVWYFFKPVPIEKATDLILSCLTLYA